MPKNRDSFQIAFIDNDISLSSLDMQSPRTPHGPESSNQELGAMDACFCHVFAKVVQLFPGETNWRLGQSLEDECGCHID